MFYLTEDRGILIANIYHMLSYAYRDLQQGNYKEIEAESFENVLDLFAAILAKGITVQLKQGLSREYIERQDALTTLRGRIDLQESMQLRMRSSSRLSCCYAELSENHYMNQILKTTARCLIFDDGVRRKNKEALKRAILFFSEVDSLEASRIQWHTLRYNRNNASYRLLMNICYLVLHELLLTAEEGELKLATFLDDQQLSHLYEKFLLEYYKKHFPQYRPSSRRVSWDTEGTTDLLPAMQTDIMLTDGRRKLIIDAKYYRKTMQTRYGTDTIRSNHLYQIYSYVKNEDKGRTGSVAGMLLYARVNGEISLNKEYELGGNRIGVKTLDLNRDFGDIRRQLDEIVEEWLR